MNCPKCGFAQEQRSDCKKCGVVFSKYYALFPSLKPALPKASADPIEKELSKRESNTAIAELQLQVRELSARFDEMESEKAERNQLRTDMENLQRLLHESLDLTSSRLAHFEEHLDEFSAQHSETAGDANDPGSAPEIFELQGQFLELRDQVRAMQDLLENLEKNRPADDLHAIRENLDHLFTIIKGADGQQ